MVERGWHYVIEPTDADITDGVRCLTAGDGRRLTTKRHGAVGRTIVHAPKHLPWAGLLRVAASAGEHREAAQPNACVRVRVVDEGDNPEWKGGELVLGSGWLAKQTSRHRLTTELAAWRWWRRLAWSP